MGSPKGGPHEGVSLRVFWNLKRTHEYKNLFTQTTLFLWELV